MTVDDETEVASYVIGDLLFLVAPAKRAAVLARAIENQRRQDDEAAKAAPGLPRYSFNSVEWENSPRRRYWSGIMRFKARVVYTFTRNITNNHSPKEAARILFSDQSNVGGNGRLKDYLENII